MRLTTYSQRPVTSNASIIAVALLVMTIILGSSAMKSALLHLAPAAQPITTLIWFGLYLTAIVGLMSVHGISWLFWLSRYRLTLVILLFGCVASVVWSMDAATSLQRTVHLLGSSLIAIYLGFMIPLNSILNVFAWVLALILFLSIGSVYVLPEIGIEQYGGTEVWRGILNSKNILGFWAAIGVLLYFSQIAKPVSISLKLAAVLMAFVSLFVLYKSDSATSQLALVVSGALCLYLFIAIRFQLGFIRMVVIAVLLTALVGLALANISTSELIGRTGDLTGRGEVWSQVWNLILQKPLTGYGYGSIWDPTDNTIWMQESLTDFTWVVYHAHNGFLQVASEIGLPLSCIALLMVIQQLIEIFYCQYERQQVGTLFVLGFVVAYLLSNYSEARFLINRDLIWIFFLALPISMLRQVNVVMTGDATDNLGTDAVPSAANQWNQPSPSENQEMNSEKSTADTGIKAIPASTSGQDDFDALYEEDLEKERLLDVNSNSATEAAHNQADHSETVKKILDDNYSDKPIIDVDINFDESSDTKDQ